MCRWPTRGSPQVAAVAGMAVAVLPMRAGGTDGARRNARGLLALSLCAIALAWSAGGTVVGVWAAVFGVRSGGWSRSGDGFLTGLVVCGGVWT